ncbi:hypothetical protein P691DRAFT_812897 [Macrolepiota fuliginosa MF-IS2]|uniref:Uncharacterized protein n=1 Tax=Macrolepiota fuliginosa MF-IS2 TaxID=1400762 RepID=A0A9P6C254_9AGAR|nr:hypothetical protein P691DRAFT_812897 [Macrolepiota fuliginosa MF-IS2]
MSWRREPGPLPTYLPSLLAVQDALPRESSGILRPPALKHQNATCCSATPLRYSFHERPPWPLSITLAPELLRPQRLYSSFPRWTWTNTALCPGLVKQALGSAWLNIPLTAPPPSNPREGYSRDEGDDTTEPHNEECSPLACDRMQEWVGQREKCIHVADHLHRRPLPRVTASRLLSLLVPTDA